MFTLHRSPALLSILSITISLSTVFSAQIAEAAVYAPTSGRTLYVSPSGSDANLCSSSAPCRQIRRALTLVQAGDLISVADGSYLGFNVNGKHGSALDPIVIQASGTQANITATTDRGDNRDNISIADSSYVILNGLRTANAPRSGLRISLSEHIIVSGGVFADNKTWGIFTDFADDVILEDNEASGSARQHGIYISNSSQRPIVRRNHLFNNALAGVQINADASAGGPGITQGALVERNLIHGNGANGAAGINLDGVHDSIIRNNVLYDNQGIGITAFRIDGASGPSGNLIANNTIVQPGNGRVGLQLSRSSGPNTVRNNILLHLGTRAGLELAQSEDLDFTDSNNNIVERIGLPDESVLTLAALQASHPDLETDSLSAAPVSLFIDAAAANYDLLEAAVAVDQGEDLEEVTDDYAGSLRPQGLATDIGAFEYQLLDPLQASFNYPVLTLPEVRVGNEMYRAELDYVSEISAANPEFQLKAAWLIANTGSGFTSNLENNALIIPSVRIGAMNYRVELKLLDPALYRFRVETAVLE